MQFKRLTERSDVVDLVQWHNKHSAFIVLDTETSDKEPRKAHLIDIQISGKTSDEVIIFEAKFADVLKLVHKDRVSFVAHNYKYDAHVLYLHGVDLRQHHWRDTLLLGHLCDENRESYSLGSYVKEYWNDPYKEEFWERNSSYEEAAKDEAEKYACLDIYYTHKLYALLTQSLDEQSIGASLVDDIHRLQAGLLRTEIEGLKVDVPYLSDLGATLKSRIDELEPQMRRCVKDEIELLELAAWAEEIKKRKSDRGKARVQRPLFSFNSAPQMQTLLYRFLSLPVQYNEKTKTISTDYASLEKIKSLHPIVGLVQENRDLQKVYGAYIEGTVDRLDNGRIYPQFRVNGTKGARISHSNPNLGQMPSSGGVKGIYVPDDGELFSEFDYSQLEVCIEAHLTQDKNLLDIVCNGASKHDITAAGLGIPRSLAKTVNFAMQYFCGPKKVASILGVSLAEGQHAWNKFWETYPGPKILKAYTDKCIDDGIPLVDLFGRNRRFAYRKRREWDKDYRSGYNFIVQSPGGQLTNNAFYKANERLRFASWGKAVLTVHDSILASLRMAHQEPAAESVARLMVNEGGLINLSVPLKVSSQLGMPRWLDKP